MFELNEAVRGRLIGVCVMVYALNHVMMCMRPGSTNKCGFTK